MSVKAIARIQKLKISDLTKVSHHNERTGNYDRRFIDESATKNNLIFGCANIKSEIEKRVEKSGATIIHSGKNETTVAVEILLSASPEFFRQKSGDFGQYDQEKTRDWYEKNLALLKRKYGANLVRVDLHLDESTPHMHAVVVPLTQKEKKRRRTKEQIAAGQQATSYTATVFDAKSMFGRAALIQLQSDVAEAPEVRELGLERGLRGSKAKNRSLTEWRKEMRQLLDGDDPDFKIKGFALDDKPLTEKMSAYRKREDARIKDHLIAILKSAREQISEHMKRANLFKSKYERELERTSVLKDKCDGHDPLEYIRELRSEHERMRYERDMAIRHGEADSERVRELEMALGLANEQVEALKVYKRQWERRGDGSYNLKKDR